jgi:DNA-binding CsgD family transcriptional regulator
LAACSRKQPDALRRIARGQSTRQVTTCLGISEKTAGNHVQNLYGKIEVSTRAGATLFAIEHGLLNTGNGA